MDCKRCFRPMRSSRTRLADAPGTIQYGSRGLCQTCYRIDPGYQSPADRLALTTEANKATLEAYLNRRRPRRAKLVKS